VQLRGPAAVQSAETNIAAKITFQRSKIIKGKYGFLGPGFLKLDRSGVHISAG
jgi:hypothetical protein